MKLTEEQMQDEIDRLSGRLLRLEKECDRIKSLTPESWQPILAALRNTYPDHLERDPIIQKFWRDVRGE